MLPRVENENAQSDFVIHSQEHHMTMSCIMKNENKHQSVNINLLQTVKLFSTAVTQGVAPLCDVTGCFYLVV